MNLFKLFKKPAGQEALPYYPRTALEDIKPASALVFYGSPGNRATELVGSRLYKFPYTPPPFHAALYLSNGEFLNVGKLRAVIALQKELLNTRRCDVIEYRMSDKARQDIEASGRNDTSKINTALEKLLHRPIWDYAFTDFLRFGIHSIKPSKADFCSENVVENMNAGGLHPSAHKAVDTAPWDLIEWAEAHPEVATISTVWEGDIFKQRLGRR